MSLTSGEWIDAINLELEAARDMIAIAIAQNAAPPQGLLAALEVSVGHGKTAAEVWLAEQE
jgi:hypothetical protein